MRLNVNGFLLKNQHSQLMLGMLQILGQGCVQKSRCHYVEVESIHLHGIQNINIELRLPAPRCCWSEARPQGHKCGCHHTDQGVVTTSIYTASLASLVSGVGNTWPLCHIDDQTFHMKMTSANIWGRKSVSGTHTATSATEGRDRQVCWITCLITWVSLLVICSGKIKPCSWSMGK